MVFSGTTVKEGEGWMLVLATGPNSASGKIREHVMQNKEDEESNKTPLEIKLEDIADDIGKFGLWSAIITLVALLIKLFYSKYRQMYYKNEMLEERIFLGFRLSDGINTEEINKEFDIDFDEKYSEVIRKYLDTGHILKTQNGYKFSDNKDSNGFLLSNLILSEFL